MGFKLNQETIESYLHTEYHVYDPAGAFILKPRTTSAQLKSLLDEHGVATWAYLTAFNPYSELKTDQENADLHARLLNDLGGEFMLVEGEGKSPQGDWPGEKSVLVLGIDFDRAHMLSKKYNQNAFLYGTANGYVDLVVNLMFKRSPGMIVWTRRPDGKFNYGSFVLGGVSSGMHEAADVAKQIIVTKGANRQEEIEILQVLGWDDVLADLT